LHGTKRSNFLKKNQRQWKHGITATLYPENDNSFKLLKKAGIQRQQLITDPETEETFYRVWIADFDIINATKNKPVVPSINVCRNFQFSTN
jgi:hypothetical protein